MLARLPILTVLALAASAVASPLALTTTPTPGAASLARRLISRVPILRNHAVARAQAAEEAVVERRSAKSDELVELMARAMAPRQASASPVASPTAPGASAVAAASASARAKRAVDFVAIKEQIQEAAESSWEDLDNSLLCPGQEVACPIFPRMGTYECIDPSYTLESCGGCTSKGQGEDCTAIKGALGVTCAVGKCEVFSCQSGYKLDPEANEGAGRCRKVRRSQQ